MRHNFQECIWKSALDEEPPNLHSLKFGWVKDDRTTSLGAIPLPQNIPLAPAEVLITIQCTCSSDASDVMCLSSASFPYSANVVGPIVALIE